MSGTKRPRDEAAEDNSDAAGKAQRVVEEGSSESSEYQLTVGAYANKGLKATLEDVEKQVYLRDYYCYPLWNTRRSRNAPAKCQNGFIIVPAEIGVDTNCCQREET